MTQSPSPQELTALFMPIFKFDWEDLTYNRQGVLSLRQQQAFSALGLSMRSFARGVQPVLVIVLAMILGVSAYSAAQSRTTADAIKTFAITLGVTSTVWGLPTLIGMKLNKQHLGRASKPLMNVYTAATVEGCFDAGQTSFDMGRARSVMDSYADTAQNHFWKAAKVAGKSVLVNRYHPGQQIVSIGKERFMVPDDLKYLIKRDTRYRVCFIRRDSDPIRGNGSIIVSIEALDA